MEYLAILKYRDTFVENYLSNYFDKIEFCYIISDEKKEELSNNGKINIKVADYELDIKETIEYVTTNNKEIILVGAEALKFMYRKASGITKYSGSKITAKIKALDINFSCWVLYDPAILQVYPAKKQKIEKDIQNIKNNLGIIDIKTIIPKDKIQSSNIISKLCHSEVLAIDTETGSLSPNKKDVLGVCLANDTNTGYYIPIKYIDFSLFKTMVKTSKKIVMHNAKFDCNKLNHYCDIRNLVKGKLEDTMILEYCINENNSRGLKDLALKYTRLGNYDEELDNEKKLICKKYKIKVKDFTYALLSPEILGNYGAKDAVATLLVYKEQLKQAKQVNFSLYYKLITASLCLGIIEQNGGILDLTTYNEVSFNFEQEIAKLLIEMNKIAEKFGYVDVNFNSPKQLADLLFNGFGYEVVKYTDTGAPSTDISVIETLYEKYNDEFLTLLIQYRQKTKLFSTYIKSLADKIEGNSIYPSFNITGTTSGRLSSNNPNFQNLPKNMRKLYIGSKKYPIVVQIDLKNAELWTIGMLANEPMFIEAFSNNEDLHGKTAVLLFDLKCKPDEVKEKYPEKRQLAKTINFGILYGMSSKRLAEQLKITKKKAEEYIKNWFKIVPNIKEYIDEHIEYVKKNGYLVSYLGRVRHLPEVYSSNYGVKNHAIRSGINFLVQSVASDLITFSLDEIIKKTIDKCEIFALVHDAIIFRTNKENLDEVCKIMIETIQKQLPFKPVVGCDVEIGDNWYDLSEYKIS